MKLYIGLLTLALQQQCGPIGVMTKGAEYARSQAEQRLKPYFPHSQAVVLGNMLLGITCADLGPLAIQQLPASLDSDKSVQRLKRYGGVIGIQSFALGFPDAILELDLSTKEYRVISANSISGYVGTYAAACAGPPARAYNTPLLTPAGTNSPGLVYVGTFRATVTTTDGARQVNHVVGALGVYRPADFERARAVELAAREEIIRQDFARKGETLITLELVNIKTTRLPQ